MSDPALGKVALMAVEEIARLRAENAELLAALEELAARHQGYEHACGRCICEPHEHARLIIARAKALRGQK